jgi:hypothetical protein
MMARQHQGDANQILGWAAPAADRGLAQEMASTSDAVKLVISTTGSATTISVRHRSQLDVVVLFAPSCRHHGKHVMSAAMPIDPTRGAGQNSRVAEQTQHGHQASAGSGLISDDIDRRWPMCHDHTPHAATTAVHPHIQRLTGQLVQSMTGPVSDIQTVASANWVLALPGSH